MTFTCDAPAKLNLCLYLGPPREDGLHELVSLFDSISLFDRLALDPLPGEVGPAGADEVICPAVSGENLVARALQLCREAEMLHGPRVRVTIDKEIPVAAGLGGGSADAAAALRIVAALYDRNLADFDSLAFELGADVPSQLRPGAAIVQGAGERVAPVDPRCLAAAERAYVVVAQSEGLATAEVFAQADALGLPRESLDESGAQLIDGLTAGLDRGGLAAFVHNDFAPAILALRPELADVQLTLAAAGAEVVEFTGSGPTCFGIFASPDAAEAAAIQLRDAGYDARAALPVDAESARATKIPGRERA